jgi:quinol monooxygenase YgiN
MKRNTSMTVLSAFAVCLLSSPVVGQDRHPVAAKVAAEVKDPAKPFALVITIKVKDGAGERLEAAFAKARLETKKEKGVLAYDMNRDAKEPGRYLIYERWKSLADLDAHLASEHIKALFAQVGELFDGDPDVRVMLPAGE